MSIFTTPKTTICTTFFTKNLSKSRNHHPKKSTEKDKARKAVEPVTPPVTSIKSLLPQKSGGVDAQCSPSWNPGNQKAQKRHHSDYTGKDKRVAWSCLIHNLREQTTGQQTKK
jgi:hypothetical protein